MWGTIACAAVSVFAGSYSAHQQSTAAGLALRKPDSLDRLMADHRARMDRMHRQTIWGARFGTAALLALALVSAYGLMQLFGVAP